MLVVSTTVPAIYLDNIGPLLAWAGSFPEIILIMSYCVDRNFYFLFNYTIHYQAPIIMIMICTLGYTKFYIS